MNEYLAKDKNNNWRVLMPERDIVDLIHNYILNQCFTFDKTTQILNFYLSLKTKPFVILSGISGTGKTKIAEYFSRAIYGNDYNDYFALIPVRPDWTSPKSLLGFYNPLTGIYQKTHFLDVLIKAGKEEEEDDRFAYFVCLDEMNLARVEYYFSDFLSALESIDKEIHLYTKDENTFSDVPERIKIPKNIFFIGTVNIDETTHQFSPKVLDRANTIEFTQVDLTIDGREDNKSNNQPQINFVDFNKHFLESIETSRWDDWKKDDGSKIVENTLKPINNILEKAHLHFAYRIRDEILRYLFFARAFGIENKELFVDLQVLQKILPRVKGGPGIDPTLKDLEEFFIKNGFTKSKQRITQMREQLDKEGYTSFWR